LGVETGGSPEVPDDSHKDVGEEDICQAATEEGAENSGRGRDGRRVGGRQPRPARNDGHSDWASVPGDTLTRRNSGPIHAIGNNGTIFDRFDYHPTGTDAFHLNLFGARNWFQVPNTYDQPDHDQRQRVLTYNIAPGYQHTFSAHMLFGVNAFLRQDRVNYVNYYPSADPVAATPATLTQDRHLTNFGVKSDVPYSAGKHNLKIGTQLMQTRLSTAFKS
jgi:hypothetical protein